jgi:hypothetical protein
MDIITAKSIMRHNGESKRQTDGKYIDVTAIPDSSRKGKARTMGLVEVRENAGESNRRNPQLKDQPDIKARSGRTGSVHSLTPSLWD